MKCCEKMVRLVTRSSKLKVDDVRLKGSPIFAKFCNHCDNAALDDVRHLVLQCPEWQPIRNDMLYAIESIPDGSGQILLNSQCDLTLTLLGKPCADLTADQMDRIWETAAIHIAKMYDRKLKQDIG